MVNGISIVNWNYHVVKYYLRFAVTKKVKKLLLIAYLNLKWCTYERFIYFLNGIHSPYMKRF